MEEQQIGWIAAIIIGAIAGWLAEQFMKSQMGLVMNIVLGIIGAAVASWLFGFLGITFGGWLGYLIAGFIGACILIAIVARSAAVFSRQRTWKPRLRRRRYDRILGEPPSRSSMSHTDANRQIELPSVRSRNNAFRKTGRGGRKLQPLAGWPSYRGGAPKLLSLAPVWFSNH